jgi:hypothetical protein
MDVGKLCENTRRKLEEAPTARTAASATGGRLCAGMPGSSNSIRQRTRSPEDDAAPTCRAPACPEGGGSSSLSVDGLLGPTKSPAASLVANLHQAVGNVSRRRRAAGERAVAGGGRRRQRASTGLVPGSRVLLLSQALHSCGQEWEGRGSVRGWQQEQGAWRHWEQRASTGQLGSECAAGLAWAAPLRTRKLEDGKASPLLSSGPIPQCQLNVSSPCRFGPKLGPWSCRMVQGQPCGMPARPTAVSPVAQ